MFILRRLDAKYGEFNTNLGDYYTLIQKEKNNEQFKETVKLWDDDVVEKLNGVIVYEDGESIMPIYDGVHYYVMTSDGKTFANISNK